ncbi:hypothetical protein P7K49_028788, partial [Saguinus oedipus]
WDMPTVPLPGLVRMVALKLSSPIGSRLGHGGAWGLREMSPCARRLLSLLSPGAGLTLGSPLGLLPPTQLGKEEHVVNTSILHTASKQNTDANITEHAWFVLICGEKGAIVSQPLSFEGSADCALKPKAAR